MSDHDDDVRTSRLGDFCRTWIVRKVEISTSAGSVESPWGMGSGEDGRSLVISPASADQVRCPLPGTNPMSSPWDGLHLELTRNVDGVAVLRGELVRDVEVELMLFAFGTKRILQCRYHRKAALTLWHDGMWHAPD